jgi:hypothetical protein
MFCGGSFMAYIEQSVFDEHFLSTVRAWFEVHPDIFVVVRLSHTAGGKDYLWLNKFETFDTWLRTLPPKADVCVFRDDQFPLRGVVNDDFIRQALQLEGVTDDPPAVVLSMVQAPDTSVSYDRCYSYDELGSVDI